MPMGSQDFWYNPTWGPENGSILISLVPTSASPGHKCCKSKISSPACMPSMQDRQGRARGGVERLLWRGAGALPWDRESGVRWGARNPMLHARRPWSAPAAAAANSTCAKTAATAKATMPVHMYLLRALGAQQNGERRSKFCRITAGRARGMSLRACVK
jgi:hypothetical protein